MAKTLYRDRTKGKVSGVSAGIADYFDVDATMVRLLILALIIFSGIIPGLIFYIIAAAIMPEKGVSNG